MKAPKAVCRYIGPTLIPQAGVAIGLTLVAQQVLPADQADTIRAVIPVSYTHLDVYKRQTSSGGWPVNWAVPP